MKILAWPGWHLLQGEQILECLRAYNPNYQVIHPLQSNWWRCYLVWYATILRVLPANMSCACRRSPFHTRLLKNFLMTSKHSQEVDFYDPLGVHEQCKHNLDYKIDDNDFEVNIVLLLTLDVMSDNWCWQREIPLPCGLRVPQGLTNNLLCPLQPKSMTKKINLPSLTDQLVIFTQTL